jgi:hypothetical protein
MTRRFESETGDGLNGIQLVALVTFNQAPEYVAVAGAAQAPIFKVVKFSTQSICPGRPAPVLRKTTPKCKKSRHDIFQNFLVISSAAQTPVVVAQTRFLQYSNL